MPPSKAPDSLRIHLLGELALFDRGQARALPASRKSRALFVYLLQRRKPVRREQLCELFFDLPDDPRAALRWSLSKIRAMLGDHSDALVAGRERVELRRDALVTDVERMQDWMEGRGAPFDLPAALEAAMEPALAGLDLAGLPAWDAWLAAERAQIDLLRAQFLAAFAVQADLLDDQRRRFEREAEAIAPAEGLVTATILAETAGAADDLDQIVRYCVAPDGVSIAYACTGQGPPLVKAANWLNHLELDWSGPIWGRLFHALSEDHQLVRYDERGNGLSDWNVEDLGFDAFVRDLETVVDSLGLDRFPLLGISQGCAVSIEYAARHPERVTHLVLLGGYAAGWSHVATPEEAAQREAVITLAAAGWGQDNPVYRQLFSQTFMPSASHEELDWFNEFQRRTAPADNAVRFLRAFAAIDVRPRLAQLRVPTLVLHARNDQRVPLKQGILLAAEIPQASLVTLETDNHIPLSREPATEQIIACIRSFLKAEPVTPALRRRHMAAPVRSGPE